MRHEILQLQTADGEMKTHLFSPDRPSARAIVVYMDVYGIRDELLGMCRAFAERGFAVYLPNVFYRVGDIGFPVPKSPDARADPAAVRLNMATTIDMTARDLPAILQHGAERTPAIEKFGAVGYCMGGRHALNALAAHPRYVKSAASIHGGRLVTQEPDSPHLFIASLQGPAYFAFAKDDKSCPDVHQRIIETEIAHAPAAHSSEHFDAHHGWSFPGRYCYDATVASRVFDRVVSLFNAN